MVTKEELIDEASRESFPASDVPSWTPTHAGGARAVSRPRMVRPRDLEVALRTDIDALSTFALSSSRSLALERSAEYVCERILDADRSVTRLPVSTGLRTSAPRVETIETIVRGVDLMDHVIIGARYDVSVGRQGTVDGTGIGVLLALARLLRGRRFLRTVRLVAFASEKPHAHTGSRAYAARVAKEPIALSGMLDLDGLGVHWPGHRALRVLVPQQRELVAFVGDRRAQAFLADARDAFRLASEVHAYALPLPSFLSMLASSDNRSFRRLDCPSAMVTRLRPANDKLGEIVFGLASVVSRLAGGDGDAPIHRTGD